MMKERKIDRFNKYMIEKGLNDNKVTVDLALSIGTLGKSKKEGRDLSDKNIEKILNFYTDLNKVWLLTGEGEMLNEPDCIKEPEIEYQRANKDMSALVNSINKLIEASAQKDKIILQQQETISKMLDLIKSNERFR